LEQEKEAREQARLLKEQEKKRMKELVQQEKEAALLLKQQQAENRYGAKLETFFKEAQPSAVVMQQPQKATGDG